MIQFRKLVIENFMSFRERQVISLDNLGVVRIEGVNRDDPGADSNMAGKSTIFEALLWCLFGKTLRGLKHEAVVNRKANKNCRVSTWFRTNDVRYSITRFRRDKKHKNNLQLFRGDRLLSYRHEVDTQAKVEEILEVDFQAFVNSTVFGGFDGARKQFALLTDREQKRILDSFLHFEKFELALDRTKDILSRSRKSLTELELRTERHRGKVLALKGRIEALERSIGAFREKELQDVRKLEIRLKRLPSLEKPSNSLLKRLQDTLEGFLERKARAEEKLRTIRRKLRSISEKRINRERMVGKPCPGCGRVVTRKSLSFLLKHLVHDRKRLRMRKTNVSDAIERLESEVTYGRERLKRLQERWEQKLRKYNLVNTKRKELERRLGNKWAQAPFSNELVQDSTEYSKQTSRLLVYEYELQALRAKIKDLEFWEVGFGNSGVKTLIVREVLPVMNSKLKEYAREVFQSGVELEFRASKETKGGEDRELFHLHYSSRLNSKNYVGESSGGRRRIDICVLLVFSWLSRCCNLLLVDELLDGLDESGRETVFRILERQRRSVLVISHERGWKSQIGNVWTVKKKDGVSTLEIAA